MRTTGRVIAWIVLVVAGLATLVFVAVAIDNDGDSDLIVGGIALGTVAAVLMVGAYFVQRALREPARLTTPDVLEVGASGVPLTLEARRSLAVVRISPAGLTVRRHLFSSREYAWSEIDGFRAFGDHVVFRHGVSGERPLPEGLGIDPQELAAALDQLQTRYTSGS